MAEIAPFRAIRYDTDELDASAVLAPPYDVIDAEGRAALASKHDRNSVHLILPEAPDGGDKYRRAADTFDAWLSDGTLIRDARPAVYRYHQVFTSAELGGQTVTRRGFIAQVRLHAFSEGVVLPHERTLSGPKVDRLALMDATSAHLSQIFAMYSDPSGETDRAFAPSEKTTPVLDGTTDDGTRHVMWRVDDREVLGVLRRIMSPLKLYIADGHHRYETMLALRERIAGREGELHAHSAAQFGTLFLANMDDPGLVVLPTHRMVHSVDGFAPEDMLERARDTFDITTVEGGAQDAKRLRAVLADASKRRTSFAAVWPFCDDAALLSLKPGVAERELVGSPALRALDVTVLHSLVLEGILGIDRAAQEAQTNLAYIKDTGKALRMMQDCAGQICFIMNPTRVDQVVAVADAGEVMPQKSTFFYPKIASGVLFTRIDPAEELG